MFVYIIDRDGELDVYADLNDAEEAAEIMGGAEVVEQAVFDPSGTAKPGLGDTREWLKELRADYSATD